MVSHTSMMLPTTQARSSLFHFSGQWQMHFANIFGDPLDRVKRIGDGIALVDDFLDPATAHEILDRLDSEHGHSWSAIVFSGGSAKEIPDVPDNEALIRENRNDARQDLVHGRFAYCFRRTRRVSSHVECSVCRAMTMFAEDDIREIICRIFARRLTFSGAVSCTCYQEGDFLGVHNDSTNGSVAFVLNLTEKWRPEFGGLLHFLSPDRDCIRTVLAPRFNQLIAFDISNERLTPHFVSQVATKIPFKRLAISGWYT
jgi:hypothetical protein